MSNIKNPNIFNFATSELSQDAFICWLLSWASLNDSDLYPCSIDIIRNFFSKYDEVLPEIKNVEIIRQYKSIDILCFLNDKQYVILIEDKTNTKNHSNQLERYSDIIRNDYPMSEVLKIYFKTHDQSSYLNISGYKPFLREEFLEILNKYTLSNHIFNDFKDYLQSLEGSVTAYKELKVNDFWEANQWKGFYKYLQKELKIVGECWKYVPNKQGGFYGFFWCWNDFCYLGVNYVVYLQLEGEKLIIKLRNEKCNWVKEFRRKLTSLGIKLGFDKPRYGKSQSRTQSVAVIRDYRKFDENGSFSEDLTRQFLLLKELEFKVGLESLKDRGN